MENKIIGCLIAIALLFIRLIIEFLRNFNKDKIIEEQRKLIKKQEVIIKGFEVAFKNLKRNKGE